MNDKIDDSVVRLAGGFRARPARAGPDRGPSDIQCPACGATFDEAPWRSLALEVRIAAEEVSRLLLGWSPDECIEVRACDRCEKRIAARVLAPR